MADYYGLLTRAISSLEANTAEARAALYERARHGFETYVDRDDSTLTPLAAAEERVALEQTIRWIEKENADRAVVATIARAHLPAEHVSTAVRDPPSESPGAPPMPRSSPLKAAGGTILGIAFFLLIAVGLPSLYVGGAIWISQNWLRYLFWASEFALGICILIALPLALLRATRPASSICLLLCSYVFGLTVWMAGLVSTYVYLGTFWTVIGLCVALVGIVPLGMIGAVLHSDWKAVGILAVGLVLTYLTRFAAFGLDGSAARRP